MYYYIYCILRLLHFKLNHSSLGNSKNCHIKKNTSDNIVIRLQYYSLGLYDPEDLFNSSYTVNEQLKRK